MKFPTHCEECGAFLMGGLTAHQPDCIYQKMIEYARDGKVQNPICDFCSTPDPTVHFGCVSFAYDTPGVRPGEGSKDGWLACDPCADLIIGKAWEELAARNVALTTTGQTLIELAGQKEAIRIIMGLQAQFQKHATGEHHRIHP